MSNRRIVSVKPRNPIAHDLGSNKYHMRVVKSARVYDRNKVKRKEVNELKEYYG